MTFYKIPTRSIPHVKLMSEEVLCDGRPHVTRTLNETVIYILTEGYLILESGRETVKMLPGDVNIFEKGEFQKPTKISDCKYYYLHFFNDFDSVELSENQALDFYTASKQFFLRSNLYEKDIRSDVFNKLIIPKHFNINSSPYSDRIKACLNQGRLDRFTLKSEFYNYHSNLMASELLYNLYLTYSEICPGSPITFNENTVQKIIEFMNSHIEKHLTGKDFENEFGYSFDHMNRRFKEIIGDNIFSYLLKSRINQAKVLLYTKKISVSQAAEMTGFCNVYHFSKMFKKETGKTPSEYIKMSNKN